MNYGSIFPNPRYLELGWRIAIFVGYGRLVYALGLEDVGKLCPSHRCPRKHANEHELIVNFLVALLCEGGIPWLDGVIYAPRPVHD